MVAKNIVGAPSDAAINILTNTSVERSGDRTIVRFTASQHWPAPHVTVMNDGPFRVMWAIGEILGGHGCVADIGFHGIHRGVAPIKWLMTLGSTECRYNPSEMGDV